MTITDFELEELEEMLQDFNQIFAQRILAALRAGRDLKKEVAYLKKCNAELQEKYGHLYVDALMREKKS